MEFKTVDLIEIESRIVVTLDWKVQGDREIQERLLNGFNVIVRQKKESSGFLWHSRVSMWTLMNCIFQEL